MLLIMTTLPRPACMRAGQTGTGKTFTMEGVDTDPRERGIIPRAFDHIFSKISQTQNEVLFWCC